MHSVIVRLLGSCFAGPKDCAQFLLSPLRLLSFCLPERVKVHLLQRCSRSQVLRLPAQNLIRNFILQIVQVISFFPFLIPILTSVWQDAFISTSLELDRSQEPTCHFLASFDSAVRENQGPGRIRLMRQIPF